MTAGTAPHDDPVWLAAALARLPAVSVSVFGDFCLDAYWVVDRSSAELSVETGLPVQRVREQRYGLGGAANVVANLVALGVGRVRAIGAVGPDPFGPELLRLLRECGALVDGSMIVDAAWQTLVYAKPVTAASEDRRLDFGGFSELTGQAAGVLIDALESAAAASDVVVLNQQIPRGLCTPGIIERINGLIARHPRTLFLADSRHRPETFAGAALKLNCGEAARFLGADGGAGFPEQTVRDFAARISARTGRYAFITRGELGLVGADGDSVFLVPGIQMPGPADPVGAGDTVVAALAAMLGSGQTPRAAATVANFAAVVTTGKLQTTGTATPAEILAASADPDYIYAPEVAAMASPPRFAQGTRIEIVTAIPAHLDVRACIFDHDGTLSTLREGWEGIMESMMLRSILGDWRERVDPARLAEIRRDVRQFIDSSTGAQTLVQMQGLVERVRRAGYVAADQVLDAAGYKRLFAQELAGVIRGRLGRLLCGSASPAEFQVRDAAPFLRELQRRGMLLFLVSGTDHDDVVAEARALGYADVFAGRIFGASGDLRVEAKKVVLDRLTGEYGLAGHQFAVFGDGPVEMRAARRRGGLAVGVASDEVDRAGVNPAKRRRLVRAGADLIIADYGQMEELLGMLRCRSTILNS